MEKLNLGWKTISGALLTVVGYLSQPDVLAVMPEKLAAIVTSVGILLSVFGLRVAVAKVESKQR